MSKMDEIFKKQLQQRQEAVPDHLWAGIERQLHDKPKRRVLPLYAVTSIAVITILAITWWAMSDKGTADQVVTDMSSYETVDQSSKAIDMPGTSADNVMMDRATSDDRKRGIAGGDAQGQTDDATVTGRSQAQESTAAKLAASGPITTSTERSDGASDQLFSESSNRGASSTVYDGTPDPSTVPITDRETITLGGDNRAAAPTAMTNSDEDRYNGSIDDLASRSSSLETEGGTIAQPTSSNTGIQWLIEQTDNVIVNTISAPEIMKSEAFNRRRELYRVPEEIASIIELNTIATERDVLTSVKARASAAYTECPSFSKDHSGMFVDVYMSHDLPFRSLSARTTSDQQLLDLRSSSESAQYSYGLGGRVSLRMPSGWSVRTGLHYTQINEAMSFVGEDGQTYDFDNSFRMFDLPLLLGRDFGADGSRLYFSLNAGVLLNMTFGHDATILDAAGMPVDAGDAADEQRSAYTDNAGLSLYVGGAAYYRLTSGIDIFAEPYMRYLPGNLTSDTYGLQQQYSFVGVNTGLRVRF